MSTPGLTCWPQVGDRFTSLTNFKLACFGFAVSIGCELSVLRSDRDSAYLGCALPPARGLQRTCDLRISSRIRDNEAVVTHIKTGHSCNAHELEERRRSGQAATAMQNKIAKLDRGAGARKRRREIGVERLSTTLSKKSTPMSYAGVEVNEYAQGGASARLPTLSEPFPSFDSALKLCRLYATSRDFWLDYRWQPDEEQYCLECTQGRKTRASSSSGACPYSVIIRQDWDGLWYRRPSELEHNHSNKHGELTLSVDDGDASSDEVLSVSWSRRSQRNTVRTASASNSFETASFALPSTPAEVKKRSAAHLQTLSPLPLPKKPRSSSNASQPSDDLVTFAAGLRQRISGAGGDASYQDAQALIALGVHSICDLVQLVSLAPSTLQAMIAECESGGRAEGVLKALLRARL